MSENKSTFHTELSVIPEFGWFLAFTLGICTAIGLFFPASHERGVPHPVIPVLLALCGAFVVCVVLLLSYVNRDAARRGMSPTLWTLICLFVPNLIGFILYFLLRKSLPTQCPGCGFTVNDSFRFCPRCRYALAPVCGSCGQPIRNNYACCPFCGQATAPSGTPSAANPA
ncbi:MAG: PLDc N-terminal domain-containing protein [Candidatus Korobacteraceae bacterium]